MFLPCGQCVFLPYVVLWEDFPHTNVVEAHNENRELYREQDTTSYSVYVYDRRAYRV